MKRLYDGAETFFGGKVDLFCNNAGIYNQDRWKATLDINLTSVMCGTELAMSRMDVSRGGGGGMIVNTASLAGITAGSAPSAAYFASKHGVVALTKSFGNKFTYRESGVAVKCLCPAFADTAILSGISPREKRVLNKVGVMRVEHVGDAFIKLIKTGGTGE